VDRSHANSEYNPGGSDQVPTENYIQIRCAQKGSDRQWYVVQRSKVCQMLCGFRHPTLAIICSAPADERASRASQWTNPAGNED
jgi:hypothetical protein